MKKRVVVAVGGNSLIGEDAAVLTMASVASMVEVAYEVVVTHGNGPQVGQALLRSEMADHLIAASSLEECVAETQGSIGYLLQTVLSAELQKRGIEKTVAAVVTRVVVDKGDLAFQNPTKPIGEFYGRTEAVKKEKENGWRMMEDAGRGWRRVMASPTPKEIIEFPAIKALIKAGLIVIAAGGGGIPVVREKDGIFRGVPAVIDKDRASALLASALGAEILAISTSVERVCLNFGTEKERPLTQINIQEARKYMREGHFAPGSMLPKIEAAVQFLESGGREVIITDPAHLMQAVTGDAGTRITR